MFSLSKKETKMAEITAKMVMALRDKTGAAMMLCKEALTSTDLVVGLFPNIVYRNQFVQLEAGDSLVLFTDGVTEAEDAKEEQLGLDPVSKLLETMHGCDPAGLLARIDAQVNDYIGDEPAGDDVTMLALSRCL